MLFRAVRVLSVQMKSEKERSLESQNVNPQQNFIIMRCMYFHNETAGKKKWYWHQKEMLGFSLCAGSLQRAAIKPLDFNRMLCRRLVVIMSQQIPACRDTWVEGGRVCVQLVSPQGSFISPVLSHVGHRYDIYTDVCLSVCVYCLSFPHSSRRVTLVSVGCERKSLVCRASTTGTDLCKCVNEAFSMPQWINHSVWSAALRLSEKPPVENIHSR